MNTYEDSHLDYPCVNCGAPRGVECDLSKHVLPGDEKGRKAALKLTTISPPVEPPRTEFQEAVVQLYKAAISAYLEKGTGAGNPRLTEDTRVLLEEALQGIYPQHKEALGNPRLTILLEAEVDFTFEAYCSTELTEAQRVRILDALLGKDLEPPASSPATPPQNWATPGNKRFSPYCKDRRGGSHEGYED